MARFTPAGHKPFRQLTEHATATSRALWSRSQGNPHHSAPKKGALLPFPAACNAKSAWRSAASRPSLLLATAAS